MLRIIILLLVAMVLSSCNTPSPEFRGLPTTQVTVEGSSFDVRVRNNRAEALRTNVQYAPRFGPIQARAGMAMAQVSGCEVVEVYGDQSLAFGRLDCGDGPPPKRYDPHPLYCTSVPGTELNEFGGSISVEIECR